MAGGGRRDGGMFWVQRLLKPKLHDQCFVKPLSALLHALPNKIFGQITSVMEFVFKYKIYYNGNLSLTPTL